MVSPLDPSMALRALDADPEQGLVPLLLIVLASHRSGRDDPPPQSARPRVVGNVIVPWPLRPRVQRPWSQNHVDSCWSDGPGVRRAESTTPAEEWAIGHKIFAPEAK